ncbi:MAG: hypothetical protein V3T70_01995 [Phycisphaerae bacterium]
MVTDRLHNAHTRLHGAPAAVACLMVVGFVSPAVGDEPAVVFADAVDALALVVTDSRTPPAALVASCKQQFAAVRRIERDSGADGLALKNALRAVQKYGELRQTRQDYVRRLPYIEGNWNRKIDKASAAVEQEQDTYGRVLEAHERDRVSGPAYPYYPVRYLHGVHGTHGLHGSHGLHGLGLGHHSVLYYDGYAAERHEYRHRERAIGAADSRIRYAENKREKVIDRAQRAVTGVMLRLERLPSEIDAQRSTALDRLATVLPEGTEPVLPTAFESAVLDGIFNPPAAPRQMGSDGAVVPVSTRNS